MPKPPKGKNANARVSEELYLKVQEYADYKEVSVGYIIREALQEYAWSHPLKTEEVARRRVERQSKLRPVIARS